MYSIFMNEKPELINELTYATGLEWYEWDLELMNDYLADELINQN